VRVGSDDGELDIAARHFARGQTLWERQEWEGAQEAFAAARQSNPEEIEYAYWLGWAHAKLGLVQDALETWGEGATAGHLQCQWQLGLLLARQGRMAVRLRAIVHLESVLERVANGEEAEGVDRLYFTLGALYAEKEGEADRAVRLFRRGLSLNPLSAIGHNSLGQLLMQGGQVLGAMGEFKVAIQLDPSLRAPYSNLARLFLRYVKPDDLELEYRHIAEEFEEKAPQVLANLSQEMVEVGKQQVYEGFYTKGHRLKNLMGLMGSRLRSVARKDAAVVGAELAQLESDHERLYDEWVGFLGAMKSEAVRPVRVEAVRVVKRVVEVARSQVWKSQLQVRVQEGVPTIEADERMLREAILNLCLNALEVLEEGRGGQVVLGVGFDPEKERVFIEVEDDGPGIAEEHLDLVFEPGFTTRERGNGYGLSIARRIAHAHQGELRVVSRMGHGSVFRMDLPLSFTGDDS
jgi:signal transduction histidine kinase